MTLFRLLVLGLLIVLIYRTIRDAFAAVWNRLSQGGPRASGRSGKKSSSWNLDESQIQDAEFQDLDK